MESLLDIARDRLEKCKKKHAAFAAEAAREMRGHNPLGGAAVVLTTAVSTAIIVDVLTKARGTTPALLSGNILLIGAALMSIGAAVFSTLQLFLKHAENAEKFQVKAARFACLEGRFEVFLACASGWERDKLESEFKKLLEEFNRASENIPIIPAKLNDPDG